MSAMCTEGQRCRGCRARAVTTGARTVASALPTLGTVVAVTANGSALLSHTGDYLAPAFSGDALRCGEYEVALRMTPELVTQVMATPEALVMSSGYGSHHAHFTPQTNRLVVESLVAASPAEPEADELPQIDWDLLDWRQSDQLTHLDGIFALDRYRVLPFTGARRIDARVVPYFMAHLGQIGLPVTIGVPGGGCLQLHRGIAESVEPDRGAIAVAFAPSDPAVGSAVRYAIDPVAVTDCWVTSAQGPAGPTSAVEFYDATGRCVSIVTQTGAICPHLHDGWETLTAMLPDPEEDPHG